MFVTDNTLMTPMSHKRGGSTLNDLSQFKKIKIKTIDIYSER